jgi:c-di-GMP-related signal transduction protein
MRSVFVARQPIFELGKGLYGYELLYRRDANIARADGEQGHMSTEVIANALLGIGLRSITNGSVAFINFSRHQLLEECWTLFEPGSVIIELLESVEPTPETIAACRRMVQAGYRLALDDYVYSEASKPLLDLASIVKVDVLNQPIDLISRIVFYI